MIEQTNIFDLGVEDKHYDYVKYFKTGTTLKLFEAFAGVGCQAMAFKRLELKYESVGISEIDKHAINSYNAIHGDTKNYGDISKMTEIPPCDIFTWSFPCTDLSKAGKQKGLNGTRSGLVYEVLRLLKETAGIYPHRHIPKNSKIHSIGFTDYYSKGDKNKLPKVLIMENVVDLVQEKFKAEFYEIQKEIESLGYKNYTTTLNAKHHGVAQNRDRVFMVSLLGGGRYEFPPRQRLDKRLKDYLEDNVAEKYYLSEKMIKGMQETSFNTYSMERSLKNNDDIASAIIARFEGAPQCVEDEPVCLNSKVNGKQPSVQDRIYDIDGTSTAITTSFMPSIAIPEATKQGYALASDGDGVYINRPHQKRGVVQKGMIQTLKTSGDDVGVVVKGNYSPSNHNASRIVDDNGLAPAVKENHGTITAVEVENAKGLYLYDSEKFSKEPLNEMARCLKANKHDSAVIENNLHIRKLTPKECWRLMGISDEDFDKAAKVCSNSQLYKQAGNGIVVDVFAGILQGLI